jgi:hypothetical protein
VQQPAGYHDWSLRAGVPLRHQLGHHRARDVHLVDGLDLEGKKRRRRGGIIDRGGAAPRAQAQVQAGRGLPQHRRGRVA